MRELIAPVDLCLPDGRLNPAAVGWTRRPLHRANLRGWGRTKRWEYWGIVSPSHVIGIVLSSLDYAGVLGLYVLDRSTRHEVVHDAVVPFARGVVLPERSGEGHCEGRGGGVEIAIDQEPLETRIRAAGPRVSMELVIPRAPEAEALGVVVPWSDRLFQYTVKDLARRPSGTLVVDGTQHDVSPDSSFAVLDHGRGRWPYAMTWNWAAGSGKDRAIQLGGKWTDGTGTTENALFVDGRLHRIDHDVHWTYDRTDWMRPWRISGERVDVTLHPFHERVARTNLLVLAGETHQLFGEFTGWAVMDDGSRVSLDGLVGWAEEARNRW